MSSSRARSRFAVVATAVPLLAGALATPAFAASVTVAPYTSIGANNVVGPNAGFRNVAHGVKGSTAVLKLDVSSPSASLDRVDLRLSGFPTGPALVPDRDFSQTNGFAVFKDVSLNQDGSIGPADGAFGVADEAQGPVSTGYTVGTPSSGTYPVRIAIDGVRATNSPRYFVTVRPSDAAGSVENRQFALTLPADGVRFGDATLSPSSPVSTPTLTIDSKPPVAPVQTNFTPQSKPPLERQGATKVEDAYLVNKNENNDPDKTLVFLNDGNNTAPANFLYRPVAPGADPLPAIAAVPANGGPVFIGDGTGITNTVKVARNNQTSDDVFVRAFDTIGNLTAAIRLFDNSQASSGDRVDRSNDVKAPVVASTAAALRTDPPAARGVNTSNVAAVPTKISYTVATANDVRNHDHVNTIEARMVVSIGGVDSTDPANQTPWGALPSSNPTATNAQNKEVFVNTNGVGVTGSQMRVEGRLLDDIGNTTDTWKSTALFPKDLITPQVTGASFEFDPENDGEGDAEDRIRVVFSEPMHKATIAETGPANPCTPEAPLNTSFCVNQVLPIISPSGVWWGSNPTVKWSADLTSVLITLGPEESSEAMRLPEIGDKIRATDRVQDPAGNAAVQPTHSDRFISIPPPIPSTLTTADSQGVGRNLYNQGRDGYLDKITVTFPVGLDNAATALPANLGNFTIVGSDVQTPTAVSVVSASQFTLSFGGVMGTGETPRVRYTPPASGGLAAGGVPVLQFEKPAADYAPPALQMLVTDDADADGKLDRMVATYSEPVDHSNLTGDTFPDSYRVTGYENAPEPAVVACPAEGTLVTDPYNTATAGATPNVSYIAMCEKSGTAHNTAETPAAKTTGWTPVDLASNGDDGANESPTGWSSGSTDNTLVFNKVVDKAPPVVVSRTTKDLNSDGRLDAIDIVYGELLDGLTIEGAQFIVSNRSVQAVERLNGTTVRLTLAPIAPGLEGDTGTTPTVQYLGGNATTGQGFIADASDQRNRVRVDAEPKTATDGAGPAITGACAGTAANNGKCPVDDATADKINVFFSEALTPGTVAPADFVVEQAGGNKAVTSHAMAADNKSVTLTLANNAINPLLDATVRFPVANTVTDAANPANGNTQTAAVVAPAPPTVALNVTCPIAATEGYCGAPSVNTGAVSTTGLVRMWRLSTTARANPTPDSEFSADQPATYPPSGQLPEGDLKLYLTGKDDFGRLSPEVSDTITILRAPTLSSLQFVNTTTPRAGTWGRSDTVVDGDNVRVGATAFSTDVAKWTATNGGCLAKHMQVNYKGLTGNAGHTAVAPFSCDLNTATAPDSRKMTFPFVKVAGTTKYPVGTVLRTSTNDPGWIIQDGPNGTQVRRQFISVNARRSHMIADSTVISGPGVISVLNGIPRGRNVGYRDGSVIKSSTSGYYYLYQSVKRPISAGLLSAWKMPTTQVYTVSTGELNAHPTGAGFAYGAHPLGTFVRFPDGSVNQITKNRLGQVVRRNVTSSVALKTLVPLGQVYPANHYDRAVPFDATFTRGYRDGTLLRINATTYGVVSRTVLRTFANSTTFNTLGYNTGNALAFTASYMPRTATGYSTGAPIDRYKITSTVIKVTNLAGGSASATVLPAIGGIYGVGNVDPIPAQWDFSRQ